MYKIIDSETQGKVIFFIDEEDSYLIDQQHWYITEKKQIISTVEGILTTLPRYILEYSGDLCIDHIDRNSLNNHRYNFRLATTTQNLQNRNKFRTYAGKPTTSRYKGVTYDWRICKWKAQLGDEGSVVYLGHFETELEAAIAYNQAATNYFNKFAKLNNLPTNIDSNVLLPMNFENLIRLLLCVRDDRGILAARKFLECNPKIDKILLPDPSDIKSLELGISLLYAMSKQNKQDLPAWCDEINIQVVEEQPNWAKDFFKRL